MTTIPKSRYNWQSRLKKTSAVLVTGVILIILPQFVSSYVQSMVVKILVFSIFSLSLNLLWGYTGLFSLGHAAYFGVAGYAVGILSVHYGIHNFWVALPISILITIILSAFLGIPALRMAEGYFLLVTLAMGELISNVAQKWRSMTGGGDGLAGISLPNLHLPWFTMNNQSFYYLVFIIFIICAFLMYRIIKSPFGEALQGIRENEHRMEALGYNVWLYKYIIFIVGGLFAGVAGMLFAYSTGFMAPNQVSAMTSTTAMLMVIIGSPSLAFGPIIGALIVVGFEHVASIFTPERWPFILGAIFVLSVLFLPGGISVYFGKIRSRLAPHK